MTITIRPLHLGILGAFMVGVIVAVGVLAAAGGSDETTVDQPVAVNIDEPPTATPPPVPTPEPTAPPTATPEPEPAAPAIRSCEEIRAAGTYNSDEERAFFLANCTTQSAAAPAAPASAPASPPVASSGPTQAEEDYRRRAQGRLATFYGRLLQYIGQPSFGAVNDLLELGAICRQFASGLDALQPVPPRFRQAHDQLHARLLAFADHIATVQGQTTQAQQRTWLVRYFELSRQLVGALEDYSLVTGVELR